jgi:DNA repair and recombination protein RAD52
MSAANDGARPAAAVAAVSPALKGNVLIPQLDQARRIGAPGNAGSPLANRGQYRPPTMKRPLPSEGPAAAGGGNIGGGAGRTPLADVSNGGVVAAGVNVAADVKRQKTS